MPEQLWLTEQLNHAFAGPITSVLLKLHVHPHYTAAPITDAVAMQFAVVALLIVLFAIGRVTFSVDHPGGVQHLLEGSYGFFSGVGKEMIGHGYERHVPFLSTLGFFILTCNLIGLLPGFMSPTAVPSVPLGCAILTWLYYQSQGIAANGWAYITHFLGPIGDRSIPLVVRIPIAALLLPIELFSHLARMLSLTVRLFANMFAGDMVTLVFFSLVPVVVPLVFLGLHIGVSVIQTYIFVLLAAVYLGEATAKAH
jgi:F-type H+-transporting ATPase subunit a